MGSCFSFFCRIFWRFFIFVGRYPGSRISRKFTREWAAVSYAQPGGIRSPLPLQQSKARKCAAPEHFFTAKRKSERAQLTFAEQSAKARRRPKRPARRARAARFLLRAKRAPLIPNDAQTTPLVILRFRPKRAINVSRAGKRAAGPGRRASRAGGARRRRTKGANS